MSHQSADGLRFVALYLPQFHPIPENDAWWGRGFTEWTYVTRALPLFAGHDQPQLPTELGFTDLRLREVQRAQAALAREHGIDAFCFHIYWFAGKRLLERPVDDFLADPACDIDFCLCWANESWTRRWDASENDVLMAQTYSPESDIAFIEEMLPFFADPRYVRVGGAVVLLVYRPQHMPDPAATAQRWRARCSKAGVRLHLVACLTHGNEDYAAFGYDAGMEYPPHNVHAIEGDRWPANLVAQFGLGADFEGCIWDYADIGENFARRDYPDQRVYRCVFPSWDNTARQGKRAFVIQGTPENYECWLAESTARTRAERPAGESLLFINAWNEWAEGCHLEPDRTWGRGFLEATQRVKTGAPTVARQWRHVAPAMPSTMETSMPPADISIAARVTRALRRAPLLYGLARAVRRLSADLASLFRPTR